MVVLKTSKERSVSFNYFHAIITTTNIIDQYKVLLTVDKALFTLRSRSRVIFLFKWPLVQTNTMKRPPTTWPVPGSKIAVQCSRTVESYAKRKKPRGCWERECAPPLSQIPRFLFSLGLFYFRGRPYYLRAWRRLATLHPFRNASREEYFCKRYFPYSSGQTKTDFFFKTMTS